MTANSGGLTHGMRAAWIDLRYSAAEEKRASMYVAPEEYLTLLRLSDTTFAIRGNDEHTAGGLSLVVGASAVVQPPPVVSAAAAGALPGQFPAGSLRVFVDMAVGPSDFDMSNWAPSGLADGAVVQIRKTDTMAGALRFTDYTGVAYEFVDKRGEFITLIWLATLGAFRII